MRLTPAQCAMCALLGEMLPMGMPRNWSIEERIKSGRDFLVKISGQDFGYDAKRWHDYLWDTNAGSYRWNRRRRDKWAREVEAAIKNPEWQAAAHKLSEAEAQRMQRRRNRNASRH